MPISAGRGNLPRGLNAGFSLFPIHTADGIWLRQVGARSGVPIARRRIGPQRFDQMFGFSPFFSFDLLQPQAQRTAACHDDRRDTRFCAPNV